MGGQALEVLVAGAAGAVGLVGANLVWPSDGGHLVVAPYRTPGGSGGGGSGSASFTAPSSSGRSSAQGSYDNSQAYSTAQEDAVRNASFQQPRAPWVPPALG